MWLLISQGSHQEIFLRKAEKGVSCLHLPVACPMGKASVILQCRVTGAWVTQNTLMFCWMAGFGLVLCTPARLSLFNWERHAGKYPPPWGTMVARCPSQNTSEIASVVAHLPSMMLTSCMRIARWEAVFLQAWSTPPWWMML